MSIWVVSANAGSDSNGMLIEGYEKIRRDRRRHTSVRR